jgi:hypothetical protein
MQFLFHVFCLEEKIEPSPSVTKEHPHYFKMSRNMDNASTSTSGSEWQTVRSRRSADKKNGYVPPHLRLKVNVPQKPTNLTTDDDMFPTLGTGLSKTPTPYPVTPRTPFTPSTPFAWKKTSFAQKINDLIALEQRTEAEREAELAAARDMEGWVSLPLKFDTARYIEFNEKMVAAGNRIANMVTDYASLPPLKYSTNYDELEDDCSVYSDEE